MECPQCGVQIPLKSLTRNSSYSTMVQCITKIRNLLNGRKEDDSKQQAEVLVSILDGVINEEKEKENIGVEKEAKTKRKPEINEPKKEEKKIKSSAKLPVIKETTAKLQNLKRYGLLLTGLSEDQKATIQSNLQKLTRISNGIPFKVIKDYSPEHVTHIICACAPKSHCPRTLKYLLGISGKSWVVSFNWILESIEAGKILKEEGYVVVGDEAVKCDTNACEKSRADPGKLFTGYSFYLNGSFTSGGPSKADLSNLIQLSGGTMAKKLSDLGVIIISDSQEFRKGEYPYTWLFDSISCYELKL